MSPLYETTIRTLFKSLSVLRCCSILSTECRTVVWCLPPNCRPISGNEASVRCLAIYMAIWRGNTMTRELFFALISATRRPNCSDTAFWIDSQVRKISIESIQKAVVEDIFGRAASWLFIAAVAALSGFGIYLGRFLRFNSWDVVFKPWQVYHGIGNWVSSPLTNSNSLSFPLLFGTFVFITYLMLYALTHLQPAPHMILPPRTQAPAPA